MTEYPDFRQRLDAALRTRDVKQVQNFLIDAGQWRPGTPADPEYAMWMMIAGSQNLRDLHEQARQWLVAHGHELEANMVLGKGKGRDGKPGARNELSSSKKSGKITNKQPEQRKNPRKV